MSNAIEVLKEMKENSNNLGIKYYVKALDEALLALEQKEKINEIIKREKYWINKILNNPKDYEKDKVSEAWFKDQLIKELEEGVSK